MFCLRMVYLGILNIQGSIYRIQRGLRKVKEMGFMQDYVIFLRLYDHFLTHNGQPAGNSRCLLLIVIGPCFCVLIQDLTLLILSSHSLSNISHILSSHN